MTLYNLYSLQYSDICIPRVLSCTFLSLNQIHEDKIDHFTTCGRRLRFRLGLPARVDRDDQAHHPLHLGRPIGRQTADEYYLRQSIFQ